MHIVYCVHENVLVGCKPTRTFSPGFGEVASFLSWAPSDPLSSKSFSIPHTPVTGPDYTVSADLPAKDFDIPSSPRLYKFKHNCYSSLFFLRADEVHEGFFCFLNLSSPVPTQCFYSHCSFNAHTIWESRRQSWESYH
ncbi:hypothetical protein KIL84_000983 [Mauremys mutica]|uniref:Uncharacterized protein n=1 Tax=Mauremys mutica TaxID=74926 RepID=A0A9D3X002_9SAUR|nr:hypothetical protein KIL84_000983 [Mauremys mutica]